MNKYRKPINSSVLTRTALKEEEGESFPGISEWNSLLSLYNINSLNKSLLIGCDQMWERVSIIDDLA